jgi:bleomycin hydrolase
MKNFAITFCLLIGVFYSLSAQQNGGIDATMMQKIAQSYKMSPETKALKNALFTLDINKLAVNSDNATSFDTYFSNQVKTKAVSDQKSSGRCWLFTGLNVLRAKAIDAHKLPADFQFSQNYLFFYDQLEKANLFLQAIIDTRQAEMTDKTVEWLFKNPIGDGGQFTGVANLVAKYGLVPQEVMPETYSSNNTNRLTNLLTLKLREFGLKLRETSKTKGMTTDKLTATKTEMLGTIYKMLALNLGEPIKEFTWSPKDAQGKAINPKQYTPLSFFQEYVNQDFSNYVMVMNDPTREYNKVYEIEYDRHVYDGQNWKYLNLPMDKIAEMAITSIKDSTALYFSCDVGKFLDRDKGYLDIQNFDYESLMGTTFSMNKKERIATFSSGSSHAMTLVAVDLDSLNHPKKWMVENSWGANYGYHGFLIMTDEWFNEYMFRLVVEKKYISPEIEKLLNQKPIVLPPWDPMFEPEE